MDNQCNKLYILLLFGQDVVYYGGENMNIKDLQPRQGKVDITLKVDSKEEPRAFSKFGKDGRVCNVACSDETGKIKVTLWNDQVDKVNVGDSIKITNGYVSEWQGEMQLSTGKFGELSVVSSGGAEPTPPPEAPASEPAPEEAAPKEAAPEAPAAPVVEEEKVE